ncbi:MAG: 4Fe-4S binding protein [Deltaproteobacteria bacterium]|jgi:dissimilatory sulfite reductase (desulfoviridin) alpha/beta subunit|nr:4Fe-4S binding protein [Deltaproteobacteria bacterium]
MAVDYKALKNGGFMRQRQKDHFSLRLKVVGGNLSADQLKTVAKVADAYGSGHVHLTSRQGLEIPFVKLKDIESVKADLAKGGVETGVCGARVRTVTACQGGEICPSGCVDTLSLAQEISKRYFGRALPHKFKFGVTGCQNNCLKAEENDLGVKGGYLISWQADECSFCGVCAKVCRLGAIRVLKTKVTLNPKKCNNCGRCVKACPTDAWEGRPGYLISFGGSFGNNIAKGRRLTPITSDRAAVLRASDAALDFFSAHGQPGERFRITVDRVGWGPLAQLVEERIDSGK